MGHTKIVNRVYTLNSSLDFYLLIEHFTTYNIIITVYFSTLYNFVMFKDICKWDLLPLFQNYIKYTSFLQLCLWRNFNQEH